MNEEKKIKYTSEKEIETKDNFICLRIMKYLGITIFAIIAVALSCIFLSKIYLNEELQQKTFSFLYERLDAIVGFYIGMITKNRKK